jgi:hypothetical protein
LKLFFGLLFNFLAYWVWFFGVHFDTVAKLLMKLIWLLFSQELLQQSFGIYSLGGRNSIKFLPHLSGGFLRRQLLNTIAVHGFWFSVIECSKFRTLPTGT